MAGKVTFVAEDNGDRVQLHLVGPDKRAILANVLNFFGVRMVLLQGTEMMEADTDGLSLNTFEEGKTLVVDLLQNLLPLQVRCPSSKSNDKTIARSVLVEGCVLVWGLHCSCAYGNLSGISPGGTAVPDALSNDDIY